MDKPPENKPKGSGLEKADLDKLTPTQLAEYEARRSEFEEEPVASEARREAAPEIAEFEALIAAFEQAHDLEALHAITELSAKDAPNHPVREPARLALYPIVALLIKLKEETNIDDETFSGLKAKHKRLDRAVGAIQTAIGIVDHNR